MTTLILVLIFVLIPLTALVVFLMVIEQKQKKEKHEIMMEILKKINSVIPSKKENEKKETK